MPIPKNLDEPRKLLATHRPNLVVDRHEYDYSLLHIACRNHPNVQWTGYSCTRLRYVFSQPEAHANTLRCRYCDGGYRPVEARKAGGVITAGKITATNKAALQEFISRYAPTIQVTAYKDSQHITIQCTVCSQSRDVTAVNLRRRLILHAERPRGNCCVITRSKPYKRSKS